MPMCLLRKTVFMVAGPPTTVEAAAGAAPLVLPQLGSPAGIALTMAEHHKWLGLAWRTDLNLAPAFQARRAIAEAAFVSIAGLVEGGHLPLVDALHVFHSKVALGGVMQPLVVVCPAVSPADPPGLPQVSAQSSAPLVVRASAVAPLRRWRAAWLQGGGHGAPRTVCWMSLTNCMSVGPKCCLAELHGGTLVSPAWSWIQCSGAVNELCWMYAAGERSCCCYPRTTFTAGRFAMARARALPRGIPRA